MRIRVQTFTGVLTGAWGLAVLLAQQPAPTFRGTVDVVQVDVRVLDRDRRPVHGLTSADFTVLENGQPRPIVDISR